SPPAPLHTMYYSHTPPPLTHDAQTSRATEPPQHPLRCAASAPARTTDYRLAPSPAARRTTLHTIDPLTADCGLLNAGWPRPRLGRAAASGTDARPSNTATASVTPPLPAPRALNPAPGSPLHHRSSSATH